MIAYIWNFIELIEYVIKTIIEWSRVDATLCSNTILII